MYFSPLLKLTKYHTPIHCWSFSIMFFSTIKITKNIELTHNILIREKISNVIYAFPVVKWYTQYVKKRKTI